MTHCFIKPAVMSCDLPAALRSALFVTSVLMWHSSSKKEELRARICLYTIGVIIHQNHLIRIHEGSSKPKSSIHVIKLIVRAGQARLGPTP